MPGAKRFYVSKQAPKKELVLDGIEHNHLAHVLRLKVGDEIIVVCGDEFDYLYKIKNIAKSGTILVFDEKRENIYNPKSQLVVYLGVIKYDNLGLVVEKLNEIGVTEVVLFKSVNCQNVQIKIDKLQTVANQSCKQCGRSVPLKVRGVLTFDELLKEIPSNTIFADEKEESTKIQNANAIIIGPEGGFADTERDSLRVCAKPATLGTRILRAETAAIIGAGLILSQKGEI